jgi:hypothetical protein
MCNAFRSINPKARRTSHPAGFFVGIWVALADGGTEPGAAAHARIQI